MKTWKDDFLDKYLNIRVHRTWTHQTVQSPFFLCAESAFLNLITAFLYITFMTFFLVPNLEDFNNKKVQHNSLKKEELSKSENKFIEPSSKEEKWIGYSSL